ncbi:hypothetical protein VMCG_07660 [Cytospora schulzeri]|uniref:Major facilitator superfamily (MFS) profile domain-containing protein n=1 Tax=Cytospora schulzeri TaxID=448051 RepID=A0A423VYZ4_9PEZI|nr:hypothetical protein VMCG_07660 [Valsa malicola]
MSGRLRWRSSRPESVNDYTGVLIPLDQAHLHSHSARCGRMEYEEVPDDDGEEEEDFTKDRAGEEHEETGMLEMNAAEYSVEGLRREGVSLILPSLSAEFGIPEKTVRYTTSAVYLGLCFGSFTWGVGADILGRRVAFNMTLLITSIFGTLAAFAPSWPTVCLLFALLGFGVGGNLPVDGALFLEFLPGASSSLLTLLSVWWPVGQLCSSLIAWFFIGRWPADQGWRRFILAIGVMTFAMFIIRFFLFHLFESPKFLLSRGRQSEAVAVVHGLAHRNGAKTWLTEEILDAVVDDVVVGDSGETQFHNRGTPAASSRLSTKNVLKAKLQEFSGARIRPLFSSRKLGLATSLIWFCWATIGMGYPLFNAFLPQYLSHGTGGGGGGDDGGDSTATSTREADATDPTSISAETYRNYAILSIVGVPGSILAYFTVDSRSAFLGRKGTLAISTFVSASFLFLFVNYGKSAGAQLAFSCVEAFSQNIMYGVLYAFTPEIFPAPVRGAGTGVASFLNRVAGLIAPILAANIPGDGATTPIYLSGVLIFAAFPPLHLIPQARQHLRVARERRELHLDHPVGVLVDALRHLLELVQAPGRARRLVAAPAQLQPAAARLGREVRDDLVQRDGEGDAQLAGEEDGLEGQVGRVCRPGGPERVDRVEELREDGVDQVREEPGVVGPRDGVDLEQEERGEGDPPPVYPLLEVPQLGEDVDGQRAGAVVTQEVPGALHDVVPHHGAVPPPQHVGPEPVVREPLDVVAQGLVGRLHADVDLGVEGAPRPGPGAARLVRVHDGRELAVAPLDVADGGVVAHAQDRVEVAAGALELPVGLVDGEDEVRAHDEDVDAPVVLGEARLAGLGAGGAGADGQAVVGALDEAGGHLFLGG